MFKIANVMNKVTSVINNIYDVSNKISNIQRDTPPILLGNIKLELVSGLTENFSNDVPMIPLDNGSQISDNISMNPNEITFTVQIVGDNHAEIFEKIIELRDKRELVDLYCGKLYKNLAITDIEKTTESLYYTEFSISLVQIKIVHLGMVPAPSAKAKPVVSPSTKIKTNSNKKDWEGELASEKIKLPGETK